MGPGVPGKLNGKEDMQSATKNRTTTTTTTITQYTEITEFEEMHSDRYWTTKNEEKGAGKNREGKGEGWKRSVDTLQNLKEK